MTGVYICSLMKLNGFNAAVRHLLQNEENICSFKKRFSVDSSALRRCEARAGMTWHGSIWEKPVWGGKLAGAVEKANEPLLLHWQQLQRFLWGPISVKSQCMTDLWGGQDYWVKIETLSGDSRISRLDLMHLVTFMDKDISYVFDLARRWGFPSPASC